MTRRDIPNLITGGRILLVPPLVVTILLARYDLALLLFLVAGLSDGLDGYLARRYHWQSRLGGFLDPAADKLLMLGAYLAIGWEGFAPVWLVVVVVGRDLVIVIGAIAYRRLIGTFEAQPLLSSKLNTVAQILYLVAVLMELQWGLGLDEGLPILAVTVLVTTLVSGMRYVTIWAGRARRERAV